jgi:hypothetical protein
MVEQFYVFVDLELPPVQTGQQIIPDQAKDHPEKLLYSSFRLHLSAKK